MKGVTILSSVEIVAETAHGWNNRCTISFCIMTAGLLLLLCMLWVSSKWREEVFNVFSVIGAAMFVFGLVFTLRFYKIENPISYKIQYQVIADDSVSLNEFIENYNIISIDGKIYTVEEKN
jgi:hypothetical protein